jgi:hypothetical protein
MGCCAAGLVVALLVLRPLTAQVLLDGGLFALSGPVGYATIGLVLTLRRPANPIGWLYAASALTWSLVIPFDPWLDQLVRDQRPLPLLAQLVAAAAVAGPVLFVVSVFLPPGPTSDTPVPFDNPFGQPGLLGQLAKGMIVPGLALHVGSLLAALLCVILRFRASRGVERQQLRWVATGAAIAVLGITVPLGELRAAWVDPVVILCVPLAVAVAVLRYRLWDLDRLISRTLTYLLVTALLVLPYLLIVPAAAHLAAGSGSLAVAAATLAAVALFAPSAAASRPWSTAASTAAATTPPAPSTPSPPASATSSTSTPSTASSWRWSTRPCSPPAPPSGSAPHPTHEAKAS